MCEKTSSDLTEYEKLQESMKNSKDNAEFVTKGFQKKCFDDCITYRGLIWTVYV